MYANETRAGKITNDIVIIQQEKNKIRKRLLKRISRLLKRAKAMLPPYWYEHLLDEFEIDLTEFK